MARDVYLIGTFDDWMRYWLVEPDEWAKFMTSDEKPGEWSGKACALPEVTLSPEEYAEWVSDGKPDDVCPETYDIMKIIKLVKDGVINVLDAAEGYSL